MANKSKTFGEALLNFIGEVAVATAKASIAASDANTVESKIFGRVYMTSSESWMYRERNADIYVNQNGVVRIKRSIYDDRVSKRFVDFGGQYFDIVANGYIRNGAVIPATIVMKNGDRIRRNIEIIIL